MARNQTLLKILNDVRAEARLSLNPAHNIADRDAQIILIQREQERLWAEHDWPHLVVDRYIPLIAGKRFYDPRTAFNDAAQSYNQAIAQFPASLLARLFGFKPAGTVTRLADGR